MKVVSHVITLFFGMMLACILMLGPEPQAADNPMACIPLYDQTGLETWATSPECPPSKPKGI